MTGPGTPGRDAARQLEVRTTEEIEKIPGVLAAAVWLRDARIVRDAYVAGAPGASLTTLRRAVGDLLRKNGLEFDVAHVHIAVLDEANAPPPLWRGRHLILDGIEVARANHRVTCTVRLRRRDAHVTGVADDLDTEPGRARAAALATLRAAERATRSIRLGLEGVLIHEAFGRRYVTVAVEAASSRRFIHLPGIGAIERSVEDAAAFAVLGAIERWLAW